VSGVSGCICSKRLAPLGIEHVHSLQTVHDDDRVHVNFLQPARKLAEKKATDGKARERYDTAPTPYRRVMAEDSVSNGWKGDLTERYAALAPPRRLRGRIQRNLTRL